MTQDRLLIAIPTWLKEELRDAAAKKGISMAEYIKDSIKMSIEKDKQAQTKNPA